MGRGIKKKGKWNREVWEGGSRGIIDEKEVKEDSHNLSVQ